MLNIIYYCPDVTTRTQVLEQLFDYANVLDVRLRRHGPGFSIQCDQITDLIHKQVQEKVYQVTFEVL